MYISQGNLRYATASLDAHGAHSAEFCISKRKQRQLRTGKCKQLQEFHDVWCYFPRMMILTTINVGRIFWLPFDSELRLRSGFQVKRRKKYVQAINECGKADKFQKPNKFKVLIQDMNARRVRSFFG